MTSTAHGGPVPAAVVVVNYRSSRLLAENLVALSGLEGLDVVVVDSWSSAREREAVSGLCAAQSWTLVPLPGNPGFGAAVNAGVACARTRGSDAVLLLNPDAAVSAEVARELVSAARADRTALLCPRIDDERGAVWFAGGTLRMADGVTRTRGVDVERAEAPWVSGACLAFSLSLWDRVGGFDDRYFMYWEDIDLSHRVRAAGGRVLVRRDLVATHRVGGTQAGEGKSRLYCRYNCRNRLLFAATHLADADVRRWLRSAPRYAAMVVQRGGRRALARHPAVAGSALRGTVEGLVLVLRLRGARLLVAP